MLRIFISNWIASEIATTVDNLPPRKNLDIVGLFLYSKWKEGNYYTCQMHQPKCVHVQSTLYVIYFFLGWFGEGASFREKVCKGDMKQVLLISLALKNLSRL